MRFSGVVLCRVGVEANVKNAHVDILLAMVNGAAIYVESRYSNPSRYKKNL